MTSKVTASNMDTVGHKTDRIRYTLDNLFAIRGIPNSNESKKIRRDIVLDGIENDIGCLSEIMNIDENVQMDIQQLNDENRTDEIDDEISACIVDGHVDGIFEILSTDHYEIYNRREKKAKKVTIKEIERFNSALNIIEHVKSNVACPFEYQMMIRRIIGVLTTLVKNKGNIEFYVKFCTFISRNPQYTDIIETLRETIKRENELEISKYYLPNTSELDPNMNTKVLLSKSYLRFIMALCKIKLFTFDQFPLIEKCINHANCLTQMTFKKIKSLVNKLSKNNCDKIIKEIIVAMLEVQDVMSEDQWLTLIDMCVDELINKSVSENVCDLYVELIMEIHHTEQLSTVFKKSFIAKIGERFNAGILCDDKYIKELMKGEDDDYIIDRCKSIAQGYIRLIVTLYNHRYLSKSIVNQCITVTLDLDTIRDSSDPLFVETRVLMGISAVESLIPIMNRTKCQTYICGLDTDEVNRKKWLIERFNQLLTLKSLPYRLKCRIMDTIDLLDGDIHEPIENEPIVNNESTDVIMYQAVIKGSLLEYLVTEDIEDFSYYVKKEIKNGDDDTVVYISCVYITVSEAPDMSDRTIDLISKLDMHMRKQFEMNINSVKEPLKLAFDELFIDYPVAKKRFEMMYPDIYAELY